jgi:hypothetical protein
MTIRSLLLALVLAAVLVASACGGDSEPTVAEYQASVVSTRDRADFALGRITKGESQDELLERMDEAAAAIDEAASELEDAGAPEQFEDETKQLTDALHQLAIDLEAVAHDVRNQIVTAPQALNFESWDQANLALAALIGEGIKVKLIDRH